MIKNVKCGEKSSDKKPVSGPRSRPELMSLCLLFRLLRVSKSKQEHQMFFEDDVKWRGVVFFVNQASERTLQTILSPVSLEVIVTRWVNSMASYWRSLTLTFYDCWKRLRLLCLRRSCCVVLDLNTHIFRSSNDSVSWFVMLRVTGAALMSVKGCNGLTFDQIPDR